jgi:nucleotidyltransferase substrate binding protein (TIGR01987 family)
MTRPLDPKLAVAKANATQAVSSLAAFLQMPIANDRDRAGVIQAFKYCYETTWKLLQKLAEAAGRPVGSPREAFVFAFEARLIADEQIWLDMIKSRNLTVHTYKAELAEQVLGDIRDRYLAALQALLIAAR